MVDYAKMYYILCAAASSALDVLPDGEKNEMARALLQNALDKAEELYIQGSEKPSAYWLAP